MNNNECPILIANPRWGLLLIATQPITTNLILFLISSDLISGKAGSGSASLSKHLF